MKLFARPAICVVALLAGVAALRFEPAFLRELVVDVGGQRIAVGSVRAPLWSVALAQSPESLTLENVIFSSGLATYEAKRIEFSGLTSSRSEIDALLSNASTASMADRLSHINAKQVTIPDLRVRQNVDPDSRTSTFKNIVLKDIEGGRIREAIADTAGAEMTSGTARTVLSYGRTSVRELDLPALARLYEISAPDGPTPLVKIHGGFSVEDLSVLDEKEGSHIKIARLSSTGLKARPIAGSWHGASNFLGELAPKKDLTTEEQERLIGIVADLFGAFDLGLVEATGFEMRSTRQGNDATIKIARFAYWGGTATQPADGRLEGFEIVHPHGTISITNIGLTGFSITPMIEGLKKLKGKPLDELDSATARSLAPTLGTLKIVGVSVDSEVGGTTTRVKSTIRELEFTADKPLNGIPTNVRFSLQNFATALPANSDADGIKDLVALGYSNVDLSFLLAGNWNEPSGEFSISDLSLRGTEMANLSANGLLGNVSKDVFNPDNAIAMVALMGARIKKLDVQLENKGLFERFLAKAAREAKTTPDALRQTYGLGAAIVVPSVIGSSEQASRISQAIARFVAKPGRLTINATAKDPAGLSLVEAVTASDPKAILRKLDVNATAE